MTSFKRLLIVSLATLASGCGMVHFEPARTIGKPCPALTTYTKDEQARAASELEDATKLFQPCVICGMVGDYGLMRDQCR